MRILLNLIVSAFLVTTAGCVKRPVTVALEIPVHPLLQKCQPQDIGVRLTEVCI